MCPFSVCNTHTHTYAHMHACPCVCALWESFVFLLRRLSVHGVGRGSMHNRHIFYMARVLLVSSLLHTHTRTGKQTHTERRNNKKKERKNASTRKLHAALSHTLSLYLRCVLSGWRSCSAALFSARHCVRLCVCVCVLAVCQRWRCRLCRFHYKLFSRAVRVVVVAVAAKSSIDDVRVPSLRQ